MHIAIEVIDIVWIFNCSVSLLIFKTRIPWSWKKRIIDIMLSVFWQYRFSAFWLRSKCSICSYQLNIWYVAHWVTTILNWFLELGGDAGACSDPSTGWPGIAVPPGLAHSPIGGFKKNQNPIYSNFPHIWPIYIEKLNKLFLILIFNIWWQ